MREFQRVSNQIEENLANAARITRMRRHGQLRCADSQVEAARVRTGAEQFNHFSAKTDWAEALGFKLDGRRIEAGVIEHIVQQIEQARATLADRLGIFALRGFKTGFQQKRNRSENAIERRANLMAGGRQEGIFRR